MMVSYCGSDCLKALPWMAITCLSGRMQNEWSNEVHNQLGKNDWWNFQIRFSHERDFWAQAKLRNI